MSDPAELDQVRAAARAALAQLAEGCDAPALASARDLVLSLRNLRAYPLMAELAEAVSRCDPGDARNRRLYAQCLIETGKASVAIDVLNALVARLPATDAEALEAAGLLGRAYKQIFFDAGDKFAPSAQAALEAAIAAYRAPFDANPDNTWHGVNLVALLTKARGLGLPVAAGLEPREVAQRVVQSLQRTPEDKRDPWYLATLAEASLGLGDWTVIEARLKDFVLAPATQAFHVASTLRQFTEVWNVQSISSRGRALVDILRARLMELPQASVELAPADLQQLNRQPPPVAGQLEAVLGDTGVQTYTWWTTGLQRARSVASISRALGDRVGTGFLVRAGDFGRAPADELLVLTNYHVVNPEGSGDGLRPADAVVTFEAADGKAHAVAQVVWSSPVEVLDAALLRLKDPVVDIPPLPVAEALPVVEQVPGQTPARVYVIGYPGGRSLAFSFQDNDLLAHEGPPAGVPRVPGVWRVHYRAPTEGGSSGSPVFNATGWQVIALHHAGGKLGMPKLNGLAGTYAANEGIAIRSIIAAQPR